MAILRNCQRRKITVFTRSPAMAYPKWLAKNTVGMYANQYGLDVTILRFANVYGSRCHGVIHDFLDKISKNPTKLEIIGTGMQSRDFVHVSDVTEALILAASNESANGKTYNIGFGKTTSDNRPCQNDAENPKPARQNSYNNNQRFLARRHQHHLV